MIVRTLVVAFPPLIFLISFTRLQCRHILAVRVAKALKVIDFFGYNDEFYFSKMSS